MRDGIDPDTPLWDIELFFAPLFLSASDVPIARCNCDPKEQPRVQSSRAQMVSPSIDQSPFASLSMIREQNESHYTNRAIVHLQICKYKYQMHFQGDLKGINV
jgi:hypothetical protein